METSEKAVGNERTSFHPHACAMFYASPCSKCVQLFVRMCICVRQARWMNFFAYEPTCDYLHATRLSLCARCLDSDLAQKTAQRRPSRGSVYFYALAEYHYCITKVRPLGILLEWPLRREPRISKTLCKGLPKLCIQTLGAKL